MFQSDDLLFDGEDAAAIERFLKNPDGETAIENSLPLPVDPSHRPTLLRMLAIDIERRWKQLATNVDSTLPPGRSASTIDDYLVRFPTLATDEIMAKLIVYEYYIRHVFADRPSQSDYVIAYPGLSIDFSRADIELQNRVANTSQELSGTSLAGYDLEEQIGRGGMGVVYRAWQRTLKRFVALKVIRAGLFATNDDLVRFRKTAEAAARLKHVGIVDIIELNVDRGHNFLTMEYIEGETLAKRIESSTLAPKAAAELIIQVARAVHYAHEHRVIHRDLKPDNILLDGRGTPHVADFGLAKATDVQSSLTHQGDAIGTVGFMSPEQAMGNHNAVDCRSDIYSLGAILYRVLGGRPPFIAAGLQAYVELVKTKDPDSIRQLNNRVPIDLDTITAKCLFREPSRRYASAQEVADELDRFLQNKPIVARPITRLEQLWMWAKRNPLVAGLETTAAVLCAILVVAVIIANSQRNNAVAAGSREAGQRYATEILDGSRAAISGPTARAVNILESWNKPDGSEPDRRGPEWHLVRRITETQELLLEGHSGPVVALAWSHNGKQLASAGEDRLIRVWNGDSGDCIATLIGHTGGIYDLTFSPDGGLLASASEDGTVRIWEVATDQMRHVLNGHILPVYAVAFSPDGSQLSSAGGDAVIRLWDVDSGNETAVLQGHHAPIGRLRFSGDGRMLASSGLFGGSKIWDLATRSIQREVKGNQSFFSPELDWAVNADSEGSLIIRDSKTQDFHKQNVGLQSISAFDFDPALQLLVIAGSDEAIYILDRNAGDTLQVHRGHKGGIRRVLLRPDLKKVASAGDDGTVRIWPVPDPNAGGPFSGHHIRSITATAFSVDGSQFATGDYLGSIAVWEARTGERIRVIGAHFVQHRNDKTPHQIGVGPPFDEKIHIRRHELRMTGNSDDGNPVERVIVVEGHASTVGLEFVPNHNLLISAGGDHLHLWDLETGKSLQNAEHPTRVSALAMDPKGRLVITGCWDNLIRLFNPMTLEPAGELRGHNDDVLSVAFHPTESELASAGRKGEILIWDVTTLRLKQKLSADRRSVKIVRYSPDGNRIVTADDMGNIRVWKKFGRTYRIEDVLYSHRDSVSSLEFSRDGKWLVTASDQGEDYHPRIWTFRNDRFLETVEVTPPRLRPVSFIQIDPQNHDLLLGDSTVDRLSAEEFSATASHKAPRVEAAADFDDRLRILGFGFVDKIQIFTKKEGFFEHPTPPQTRYFALAISLPFSRIRLDVADFQRLKDDRQFDLKNKQSIVELSTSLIHPRRFVLLNPKGTSEPAEYVGFPAADPRVGFSFMPRRSSSVETATTTPSPEQRSLIWLAWQVADDFTLETLQLKFQDDPAVPIPSLELQSFIPGQPFLGGALSFGTEKHEEQLLRVISRFAGPGE